MMKDKAIYFFLLGVALSQSCVVYQKTPVPIAQANNQEKVKIVNNYDEVIFLEDIRMEDSVFYGVSANKSVITFDSTQVKYVYLMVDANTMETAKNIIAGEFLGNFNVGVGIRYEYVVYKNKNLQIIPKAGLGMNMMMGFGPPIGYMGASVAIGQGSHYFAFGGSYLFVYNFPIVNMEYRFQKKSRGLFFSLGGSLSFEGSGENYFLPGISLGSTF